MALKSWKLNFNGYASQAADSDAGLPGIVSASLRARAFNTRESAADFLSDETELNDPFELKDMDKAVNRINAAVENGEKILVYGDYDCDGITAASAVFTYLESMGADVSFYIPERSMGYGLNNAAIDSFSKRGVNLIITVDNGISAIEESKYIAALGMELVVTDHHQALKTLPTACAVVDPHRPDCGSRFKNLCGAGVALKLIAALEGGDYSAALDYFGDIVAIGTVADVVPLESENRAIVKHGLKMLEMTENIGLQALIEAAGMSGKRLTSESIAYSIAPRINAAGRMGSANIAMRLLMSEDDSEAAQLAETVNELNAERKAEEQKILLEIKDMIDKAPKLVCDRVIVLAGNGWHHGVIGIVSARITETYGKPSVILSIDGDTATGSARSFGDFSLFKSLKAVSQTLIKFGGHSAAAGLTLETDKIGIFREMINTYAKDSFPAMPRNQIDIDCKITAGDITLENAESLGALEPFGEANKPPVFLLESVKVEEIIPLSAGKHTKIKFSQGGDSFCALLFGVKTSDFQYPVSSAADILVSLGVNEYAGKSSVSVRLKDIRPAGLDENRYFAAKDAIEAVVRNEAIDRRLYSRLIPSREETAAVYKYLRRQSGAELTADKLFTALTACKIKLNFGKILSILLIMRDVGLIDPGDLFGAVTLSDTAGKKDLEDSAFLQLLKRNA